jgi:hypothetical protein
MGEIEDAVSETIESAERSRFNSVIALLVALTATVMAICNIKDGNIVQAMAQAQSRSVDAWSYFQSKSTKQHIAEAALDQVRLQQAVLAGQGAAAAPALAAAVTRYESEIQRYDKEKAEIKAQAEGYSAEYDRLNFHDDQFDFSEACLTVAMALYGISALTTKRWLLAFAMAMTVIGIAFGLAGFVGWSLHPDWMAKLLG